MRMLMRFLLAVLLVLNGLAGAHALAATLSAPVVIAGVGAEHGGHCGDEAAAVAYDASDAGDVHGRDCCKDACQCACTAQAGLLSPLPAPWPAAPGLLASADPLWSSLRPAPLLRPPIA